ncbi:hypothetical protein VM1G_02452 [Cytospora mali]|uniref:Myb-like domain-containing protein n=1 Tax=Cytospora mali TaxID=578113 RepID=A0A194VSG4_CYTMA|nr:hypothetical protein VM1G_02452 [Valsa mali]
MDQMNHVPRTVPTPDQSHPVSGQPSTTSSCVNGFLEGPASTYLAHMPASFGNGNIDQYGNYDEFSDGLYFDTNDTSGGHFDLATTHMNSSSPNNMLGNFSSSNGAPEDMDVDMPDFLYNSSSNFSDGAVSGLYPSTHRQNVTTNLPASTFHSSPMPDTMQPGTVSPSMLRLKNTPPLPLSSSDESLQATYSPFHIITDTHTTPVRSTTVVPDNLTLPSSDQKGRQKSNPKKAQRGNSGSKWGRKALPDKAPITAPFILPSNGSKRRSEPDSSKPSKISTRSKSKNKTSSQSKLHSHPPDGASTSQAKTGNPASSFSNTTDAATSTARAAQDEFLVSSRLNGMKYSHIRTLGNFKEAESTLRGRYRTLIKPKEARVRHPQWQEIDDKLLKEAVPKLAKTVDNISWRAVSEYISHNGGTYQFGYTTCHKRWDYLNSTSDEQVRRDRIKGKKGS